jgi:hypothetical protein
MTRIIKGITLDWGDRWRRTVWAQLEHIYWFNVFPNRQVEFDRSSSPTTALNEADPGRLEATQTVKEFVEQEIQIGRPAINFCRCVRSHAEVLLLAAG